MLTGVRPLDGSPLGAVCAQIVSAPPAPPSRRNRAVAPTLDRIVARCLAKNPADRFASCDELASALYPLARSRTQTAAPEIRKRSWWSKPTGQQDVWIATAACLLLAFTFTVIRSVRARLAVPPPPARLRFSLAVPPDALIPTSQTVSAAPQPGAADASLPAGKREDSQKQPTRPPKHPPGQETTPPGLPDSP